MLSKSGKLYWRLLVTGFFFRIKVLFVWCTVCANPSVFGGKVYLHVVPEASGRAVGCLDPIRQILFLPVDMS